MIWRREIPVVPAGKRVFYFPYIYTDSGAHEASRSGTGLID